MLTIIVGVAVGFVVGLISGVILSGDCNCDDEDEVL